MARRPRPGQHGLFVDDTPMGVAGPAERSLAGPGAPADGPPAMTGARMADVAEIEADPGQPRTIVHTEALAALASSIAAHGVLQLLLVRECPGPDGPGTFRSPALARPAPKPKG